MAGGIENLKPAKPGEVRNPKGINGWTKARERLKETIAKSGDDMGEVLVALAKSGDVSALKLALGPLLPTVKHEVEHSGGVTVRWASEPPNKPSEEGEE